MVKPAAGKWGMPWEDGKNCVAVSSRGQQRLPWRWGSICELWGESILRRGHSRRCESCASCPECPLVRWDGEAASAAGVAEPDLSGFVGLS